MNDAEKKQLLQDVRSYLKAHYVPADAPGFFASPFLVTHSFITQKLRMNIAVSAVAAGLHTNAPAAGDLLRSLDVLRNSCSGHNHVALLLRNRIRLHAFQNRSLPPRRL